MKGKRENMKKGRIYGHRFVPEISTSTKVFVDKKRKSTSRSSLKKRLSSEEV